MVARALRELKFNTSHVGHETDKAPIRGSTDEVVLGHARSTGQTVVTSNHDMILLCAEQNESVIWIDPRGKQYRRSEMVVLCFKGIEDWERRLGDSDEPVCVRVLRTKAETLTIGRAAHLARQRMRRLQTRERRRSRPNPPERSPRITGF